MSDHEPTELREDQRAWLFQANPDKYRIHSSLRAEDGELWNLNQHWKEIQSGDRVVIWLSGVDAGIYAVGTVLTDPVLSADSPQGEAYWYDRENGRRVKARVLVRYDRKLVDRPLLKGLIAADPALSNMVVLRSPRGTNFRVTNEEWKALCRWLESA